MHAEHVDIELALKFFRVEMEQRPGHGDARIVDEAKELALAQRGGDACGAGVDAASSSYVEDQRRDRRRQIPVIRLSASACLRTLAKTCAPSRTAFATAARPMPVDAPVTTMARSSEPAMFSPNVYLNLYVTRPLVRS